MNRRIRRIEQEKQRQQQEEEQLKEEEQKRREAEEAENLEKVKQRLIRERTDFITEIERLMEQCGIPKEIISILQTQKLLNKTQIENQFHDGSIRLGLPPAYIWTDVHQKISKIPEIVETTEIRKTHLLGEISVAHKELKELDERKRKLLIKVSADVKEVQQLNRLKPWKSLNHEIFEPLRVGAAMRMEVERELSNRVVEQVRNEVEELAAGDDQTENPKLSLVFNAAGFSNIVIKKLHSLDGLEFLGCDIAALCEEYEIDSFADQKDLLYLQTMLTDQALPDLNHERSCKVCAAKNPQELTVLLMKLKKSFHKDILVHHHIDGKRFLAITLKDIRDQFNVEDREEVKKLRSAISYLKKIHKAALQID